MDALRGKLLAASAFLLAACGELLFSGLEEKRQSGQDAGAAGAAGDAGDDAEAAIICKGPGDCPGGDSECQKRECTSGQCGVYNVPSGAECKVGGIQCDGLGSCVSCRVNETKDPEESDIDCGGENCPKCVEGKTCKVSSDCASGICKTNPSLPGQTICFDALCTDGTKNGSETDTDCGGACQACERGEQCKEGADCITGFCTDGICCGVACKESCEQCAPITGTCDRVQAGTDPGDQFCPGITNYCDAQGRCSSCSNKQLDSASGAHESDIDCGGPLCPPCKDAKKCSSSADCASCICEGGACQPKRCNNAKKDGCEADVDCGVACNSPCGAGRHCNSKADCASGTCLNHICVSG